MDAEKRRIDRGAGHHRLSRLAKGPRGKRQSRHQTTEMHDVFEGHGGVAALAQVLEDGFVQAVVGLGIAEDSVVHPPPQGLQDGRCRGEIHVRHPERIQFRPAVKLDAAGAAAGDRGVEIKGHRRAVFSGRGTRVKLTGT